MPVCGIGVLIRVGTSVRAETEPELGAFVSDIEVGRMDAGGVSVEKGLRRNISVIAMAVLVLLECCTSASLAGPPEAIQITMSRATNKPVTPNACR